MLKNYIKTSFRNLWRNKTYSLLNIAGLCIGITCAALIFLWVEDEVSYDSMHSKKNVLFQVYMNQTSEGKVFTSNPTPGPLAQALKEEIPGVRNACRTTWQQTLQFRQGDKEISTDGLYADSSLFNMFTFSFLQGRPEQAFLQPHSIVITQTMAKTFFGNEANVTGKILTADDNTEYIITGVIKDLPENSTFQFQWLAPFQLHFNQNQWLQYWGSNGIQTFVETEPQADIDAINKKLDGFIASKDAKATSKPFLFSMNDWRLRGNFENGKASGGRIQYVRLFTTIAWIILLIACINFMNLATARSEKRSKEVGVRKVLGAGRGALVRQFFIEALIMSFCSVCLALLVMYLLLPSFNLLVQKNLGLRLDEPVHFASLVMIALICGLVAGSYPSLYLSSFNTIKVLKGSKLDQGGTVFIRKGLVVIQFAISVTLIIATIVIYQQIQHVKNRPLGYNKANLLQIDLTGNMKQNFAAVKNDLLGTGKVDGVAASMLNVLYMGSTATDFSWQGKDPNAQVLITQDWVSPEYFSATGMKIIKGRGFHSIAKQDSASVIVNETLANLIDPKDAVGKMVTRGKRQYTIAGVTSDIIYGDMYGKGSPMIFLCYPDNYNYLYLRLKNNGNTEEALAQVSAIIKKYEPGYSGNYTFVDEDFNKMFQDETLTSKLSRIFSILAIFISCLGLFGLAAYTAEKRTKEVGIRKVLGASVQGIAALLTGDFLKLILISFIISFPLAWWAMNKWLEDFAYRISVQWQVFVLAGIIALLVAMLTISFQTIKAAMVNPVRSLRAE